MSETNPEIDAQLDSLAELCCTALRGGDAMPEEKVEKLLRGLLMSGYSRKSSRPVNAELETRVRTKCPEPAMHRGGALSSLTDQMQNKYDELARWHATQPKDSTDAKSANISSSTDA